MDQTAYRPIPLSFDSPIRCESAALATALAPLGTDSQKAFLETAPCLIVVFRIDYTISADSADDGWPATEYYTWSTT